MSTTTATISSALSSDPRDRLPPLRQVDIKAVDNGMVLHQTFFPQASQILTDLKSKDMIDMSSTETTEAFQKRNMKFLNVKEKKFSTAIYKRIFCARRRVVHRLKTPNLWIASALSVALLKQACLDSGSYYVIDHGISQELMDEVFLKVIIRKDILLASKYLTIFVARPAYPLRRSNDAHADLNLYGKHASLKEDIE
ncbi:hypothetical protein MUK42_33044 [Musa troglodytarum]|uniref:Uncharacterized protein n=1 Tax=Musa troglodytarum TaxID=320322 RepID=A0A9E7L7P5_9LILI|nr:hypothetical protein MUK42_33044 [Musa troglodytarum]